jgi:hypothetical protein
MNNITKSYMQSRESISYFKDNKFLACGIFLCLLAISFADTTSFLSYGYALILLMASSFFICPKDERKDLYSVYHIYFFIAILFYAILKYQFPEYMGLNGGEGRMDDNRFYAQLVDGKVSYFYIVSVDDKMPYVLLLKWLYPFPINTPLNILSVSVIFTAYLPLFARRLAILLTDSQKIGRLAFLYSLWCPFTLFWGCVLLRESCTAALVIAGLSYFIEKKYPPLIFCIVGLTWIRFGTLAFLLCGMLLLYRYEMKRSTHSDFIFFSVFAIIIVVFYFSFSYLQEFSGGKLEDSVIRSTDGARYEESTIGAIMKLPFPINIFFSSLFFWFIPLFSIPQPQGGHYILNGIFQSFLTPLFMFFLWKPIYNVILSVLRGVKIEDAKKILFLALLFALLLGTISMQSRHKSVLFPILCILAAYGKVKYDFKVKGTAELLSAITIGGQLILAAISFIRTL